MVWQDERLGVFGEERVSGSADLPRFPLEGLTCKEQPFAEALCLSVTGELDLASVPAFLGCLRRASEAAENVIVDLHGLRYIDSSGINALLDAHQRFTRTGRRIVLAAPSPMMERILKVVSLEQVLPIFPTVDAARKGLRDGVKPE